MEVKEFVETIVKALVDNVDDVFVDETKGDRTTAINIKCNKEDVGKIIGKKGLVANAIRTIAQHVAYKNKTRIAITVID